MKHVVSFKELTPQFLPIELPPMKKLKLEYGQHLHSFLSKMEHSLFDLRHTHKWQFERIGTINSKLYSLNADFLEDVPSFLELIFNQVRPTVTTFIIIARKRRRVHSH